MAAPVMNKAFRVGGFEEEEVREGRAGEGNRTSEGVTAGKEGPIHQVSPVLVGGREGAKGAVQGTAGGTGWAGAEQPGAKVWASICGKQDRCHGF